MPVIQKDNVQMSSSDDEAISKRDIASILLGTLLMNILSDTNVMIT